MAWEQGLEDFRYLSKSIRRHERLRLDSLRESLRDKVPDVLPAFVRRMAGIFHKACRACRERDHWRIEMLAPMTGPATNASDYRTAGSNDSPALRSLIESEIQGEPLTGADEAAARSAGWIRSSR